MMPGSESDAPAYREARLCERLRASGADALDDGDLPVPNFLPHHTLPPVRNWPAPRIVWDLLADRLEEILRSKAGAMPVLLGCDCSVAVASVEALRRVSSDLHVLYIDGDFDDAAPDAARCQSAAAMAVWLITNRSPFWSGPPLDPSQVTVLGWSKPSASESSRVHSMPLAAVSKMGAAEAAAEVLAKIPATADILVHFDTDVLADGAFPATYFPHSEGLTMEQIGAVLRPVLADPRVRILEISEYAALRDRSRVAMNALVDVLCTALGRRGG